LIYLTEKSHSIVIYRVKNGENGGLTVMKIEGRGGEVAKNGLEIALFVLKTGRIVEWGGRKRKKRRE